MVAFICSSHASVLNAMIIAMKEFPDQKADLYLSEFFGGKFEKILPRLRKIRVFRAVYYMDNDFARCTYKMISPIDLDYGVRGERFKTLLSLLKTQGYEETVYDKVFAVVNCLLTRFVIHTSSQHNKELAIYELSEGPNSFTRKTLAEARLWGIGYPNAPGVLYNSYLDLTLTTRYDPILANKLLRYRHGLSDPVLEKMHIEEKNPFIEWFGKVEQMPLMGECSPEMIDTINQVYGFDPKDDTLARFPFVLLESYISYDRKTRKKIFDLIACIYEYVAQVVGQDRLFIKGHPKNYFIYKEFMERKQFHYGGVEMPLELYLLNYKGDGSKLTFLSLCTTGIFIPKDNFGKETNIIYLGDLFLNLGRDVVNQIENADKFFLEKMFLSINQLLMEYLRLTKSKRVFAPQTLAELAENLGWIERGMRGEI